MNNTQKPMPALALCVLLDIVGYASFSLPFIGELADLVWAPISGFLFYRMFGGKMGLFGGGFAFLEELLPFTDFVPTFTIAWALRYFGKEKTDRQVIKIS